MHRAATARMVVHYVCGSVNGTHARSRRRRFRYARGNVCSFSSECQRNRAALAGASRTPISRLLALDGAPVATQVNVDTCGWARQNVSGARRDGRARCLGPGRGARRFSQRRHGHDHRIRGAHGKAAVEADRSQTAMGLSCIWRSDSPSRTRRDKGPAGFYLELSRVTARWISG